MATFIDKQNRKWEISLTIGAAIAVKKELPEVDLLTPEAESESGKPLIVRLATDEVLLGQVIYQMIRPQAERAGLDETQMLEAFDGRTMRDAQAAFFAELKDFFQSRGRTDRAAAVTKTVALMDRTVSAAVAKINAVNIDQLSDGVQSGNLPE